jgi:hypothetical protein
MVPVATSEDRAWDGLGELDATLLTAPRQERFILVIDNFQYVEDDPVLSGLAGLLERHRHFHLLVCCRGHHAIETRVSGKLATNVVGPAELLLTVAEVVDLARLLGVDLGRFEAEQLRHAAGPWAAAVRAALVADDLAEASSPGVDEYLRTEVLSELHDDAALLAHLLRFSLADKLSWRLVRDLCGESEPSQLLDSMEATGLVERTGAPFGTVVIAGPMRGILRDQFKATDPSAAVQFHRRLATWFASRVERGDLAAAFHHAVEGGDWALMDELWSESIFAIVAEDPELVCSTLEGLSEVVTASRPSMRVLRDTLRVAIVDSDEDGHRATSSAFADGCARLIRTHWATIPLGELLVLGTGYLMHLRLVGRLQESAAFADRMNGRIDALSVTERAAGGKLSWFHLQRGITYTLMYDHVSAVRSYRRSWELAVGSTFDIVRSHVAANLALTYSAAGDTGRAGRWLDRHRSIDTGNGPGSYGAAIGGHLAAGLIALDRLANEDVVAELAFLGDGSVSTELWPFIAFLNAQYALHAGNADKALVQLDAVQACHEGNLASEGAMAVLITRARADLLIASSRGERAEAVVKRHGWPSPLIRVPSARIRLLGAGHLGSKELDPLIWDPATSTRDRLEMLLLEAASALRSEDRRTARRLVNQALVRGHEKVRTYGHEKSAPVATRSPQFWPSDVLTPR